MKTYPFACFYWSGKEYIVDANGAVLARFKTIKETRAFVESYNAKL